MSRVVVLLCAVVCVGRMVFGVVVPGEYWVAPDGKEDAAYTQEEPGAFPVSKVVREARRKAGLGEPKMMTTVFAKGIYEFAKIFPANPKNGVALEIWTRGGVLTNVLKSATGNPADVVFEGRGFNARALMLNGVGPHSVSGITFRNFSTKDDGGAIVIGNGFACGGFWADIRDCVFERNRAGHDGGAVWGPAEIRNSRFIQNAAMTGCGGAFYGSRAEHVKPRGLAENCVFVDNVAPEYHVRTADTTIAAYVTVRDSTVESWRRDLFGKTKGPFTDRIVLSPGDDFLAARDRLRAERSRKGNAEIVLKDGYYVITNAIALNGLDSRLTIRAEHLGKAVVTAASIIPGWGFRRDGNLVRAKVDDACRVMLTNAVRPVLSVDGVAMTHARWPDVGGVLVTEKNLSADKKGLVLPDNRAAKWTFDGAKIEGFGMTRQYVSGGRIVTGYDAMTKALCFKDSIGAGMRFFFHGVIEEVDRPGEWAYDAKTGEIVLCPLEGFSAKSTVALGLHGRGLFDITGDGVRIVGLAFTAVPGSRDPAIIFRNGSDCAVEGCFFTAFGGEIICLSGRNDVVKSCDFIDNYGCCVRVDGGDKKSLTPGGCVVDNCLFTRPCAMRDGFAVGAVRLDGVENRVSHCVINNTREHAMDWSGFGCVVEYCRMFDANLEFRDSAVVYSPGCGQSSYGCHFRFNDISGAPGLSHGIYPDDFSSGHRIYGNVVRNVGWSGIFLGGGRNNLISNNVVTATGSMALHNDNRGLFWPAWADREKWHQDAVRQIDYVDGPIGKRWPEFARWREDGELMFGNVDNVWVNNIVIDSPNTQDQVCLDKYIPKERQVSSGNVSVGLRRAPCTDVWRFGGFSTLDLRDGKKRLFKDVPPMKMVRRADGLEAFAYEKGDFNPADAAFLKKSVPGFKPIPWDKIGLYKDAWRKTLPALKPLDYAASADGAGSAGSELVRVKSKDFGTVAVKEAGLHHCWAKVRTGTSVKVSAAGENFMVKATGKKDAMVWVKVGEAMLPAGFTVVSAPKDDVDEIVLVNDQDWTPERK